VTKKKDEASLRAYLSDHLQYERWMLGEAFRELHTTPTGPRWNMVFESFCVHARNLYDFLRHEGKRANTYRADDYALDRTKLVAELAFNELDKFLFHMSADRLERAKLDLAQLQMLEE
jgi:hypothetical protein